MACAAAFIIASIFLCFRKATRQYGVTLLILFGLVATYNLYLTFDRTVERFSTTSIGAQGRIEYTKHAWELAQKFPLTGSGWGTFEETYRRYKPPTAWNKSVDHAHNDWIELLTETGWGGPIIAFFSLFTFIFVVFKKWMGQAGRYSRWSKWVGFGCIVGIIAPLFHAVGEFVFRCPAVIMTWFGLMAITWNIVHLSETVHGSRFKVQGSKKGEETEDARMRGCENESSLQAKSAEHPNHSSPHPLIPSSPILLFIVLILFVPFYAWWGWSVMKHGIAQAYVPTERNSTIKVEKVMAIDKLLNALDLEPNNAELWLRLAEATSRVPEKSELDMMDAWVKKGR